MTSNVKVCTPSEIHTLFILRMAGTGQNMQNHSLMFQKHGCKSLCQLRVFNCMPQHYIHIMYCCYKTFQYKRYTKYKYILFITTLPYRINPKHIITDSEVSQHGKRNSL